MRIISITKRIITGRVRGAYLAYETWCDSTGMESTPLADLKKQVATKKFRGSLYSKILDADSAYDSIWTYGDTKQKAYGSDCSLTIDEKETDGQLLRYSAAESKG